MHKLTLGFLVISILTSLGCPPDPQWGSDLSADSRVRLTDWLTCEDCPTTDARDAAALLGNAALGPLEEVLVQMPAEWRTSAMARYGGLARRIGEDSARLVNHFLPRFDAAIQRRSVLLVGQIGGVQGVRVLRDARDEAEERGYSADVVRTIHATLAGLELPPFSGLVSDSAVDFLDTVIVRRGAGPVWSGQVVASLLGAPFPDDVTVWRRADTVAFVAAGATGWHVVTLAGVGPGGRMERDSISIRSFPALPQSAPVDLSLDSLPRTILLSLARTAALRDTARFYRIHSVSPRTIRATAEWTGRASIDLVWKDCLDQSYPAPSGTVTGTVAEDGGTSIMGAEVTAVGTGRSAMTNSLGRFTILSVPPAWTGSLSAARIGFQPNSIAAAAGRGEYWIPMRTVGAPPPAPSIAQTFRNVSPNSTTLSIPARACRLLGLIKTDTTVAAVIARLRVTQP